MCRSSMGRSGAREQHGCGCSCRCPAMATVEEEIRLLEDRKRFMQEQAQEIDKKIAALKSAKGS